MIMALSIFRDIIEQLVEISSKEILYRKKFRYDKDLSADRKIYREIKRQYKLMNLNK